MRLENERNEAIYLRNFRKKWFKIDEYGQQTCVYSEGNVATTMSKLPEIIAGIKEAQQIANQALSK